MAEAQRSVPFMWFEPQNPSQLTIISKFSNESISAVALSADHGVGAPGTGCVEEESKALIQIVTAHERHFREADAASSNMKHLSRQYRAAVRDCLCEWRRRIRDNSSLVPVQEDEQQEENTKKEKMIEEEKINLDLLSHVYVIIHVSEIFLPMLSERFWADGDPFDKPGYVTADTVRFLRCHLVEPVEESVGCDASVLEEMVDSEYPEQFQGSGQLYWRLLEKLVLRGCLVRAWTLVEAHSLYRAVMQTYDDEGDPNADTYLDERQVGEIANAFRLLKVLLLRAPLPAGRIEDLDDALTTQELTMMEDVDDKLDFEVDFDVDASDYKLWEVLDFSSSLAGDYPLLFSAEPAERAFRKWKEQVTYMRQTSCLLRRIPEFDGILAILLGDFKKIIFDSWSEELCAELLYRKPTIRPRGVSPRASALMQKFRSTGVTNDAILAIMDGEAGTAIELMYITGGCSGAALPSTLVSLYCSLFMENGIVEAPHDVKIDRLKESAAAIVSSLVGSPLDIGVQNAVRLLIPYAERGESPELVATIACILSHYSPSSDQAARIVLSYCRPLVEQKSMQILEGCTDVLLYLYREHANDYDMYTGAVILLDGIELESFVFPHPELGACYRALAAKCHASSLHILLAMVEAFRGNNMMLDPSVPNAALSMKRAFDKHALDASKIPETRQLVCVLDIFSSLLAEKYDETGSHIVECLGTRIEASTGVVCSSSSLSLHALVLQVAHSLLKMEAREFSSDAEPSAIFDKKGMTLCLTTLNRLRVLGTSISNEELAEMTKAFMEALARAFEVENAKKSAVCISGTWNEKKVPKRSANLHQYDLATQERIVAEMLDF